MAGHRDRHCPAPPGASAEVRGDLLDDQVQRLVEAVQGWADVGVDEVIVPDFTLGTGARRSDALDTLIEQVAPAFR